MKYRERKNISDIKKTFFFARKACRNISIHYKLVLFLIISIGAVFVLYGSTAYITKKTTLVNSRDSIINLSAQLMKNLDTKVKGIETSSYLLCDYLEKLNLDEAQGKLSPYMYKEMSQNFADSIILQNDIYSNFSAGIYENPQKVSFHFEKRKGILEEDNYLDVLEEAKKGLNSTTPFLWTTLNGKKIFIRLLVDEKSFSSKGYLLFILEDSFFDFIEIQNPVIANNDMIVLDRHRKILQNNQFDVSNPSIEGLILQPDMGNSTSSMLTYENREYLVLKTDSQITGWRTLILVPINKVLQKQNEFMKTLFLVLCSILTLLFGISYWIITTITKNINILKEGMNQFEESGKTIRLKPYNYDEVGLLIPRFNYMTMSIQQLNEHIIAEREKKERAEFQAAQARVNPHFLYNTLGSIKWIAHREQQQYIEKMIDALIYLLRFSIKKTDVFITLKEEIEYTNNYLELQKMRFGERFHVEISVSESDGDAMVLGFILEPIVENALYHGIDMETGEGKIRIFAEEKEGWLSVRVEDNGKGMTDEQIKRIMEEEKEYKGFNSIGIQLISIRLKSYYPEHKFQIKSQVGKGTEVIIKIPYKENDHV